MIIFGIILIIFVICVIFAWVCRDYYDSVWVFASFMSGLALLIMVILIATAPMSYLTLKSERDVLSTIYSQALIENRIMDACLTQNIITINTRIKQRQLYNSSNFCGVFYDNRIMELEQIK